MIQEFFNSMLALLLAKFILNDVPHAAGFDLHTNPSSPKKVRKSTAKFYYHHTHRALLPIIMQQGLVPQERTSDAQEWFTTRRIYLLEEPDEESSFYGDVILKVRIPPGVKVKQSMYAEGVYVTEPIPPSYIEVIRG